MGRDLWFPSALWEGKQDVSHVHRLREPGFLRRKSNCPRRTPLISSSRFKGSPALIALPSCFPNTPLLWGGLGHRCLPSCQTAGTDEAAQESGSEEAGRVPPPLTPPPPPHTIPPGPCRGEAEMLQSAGDQRGHGRAANPPTSLGPPQLTPVLRVSLGGERPPPNGA